MYLAKPQRNMIFEAIARTGLDLAQCDLRVTDDAITILHNAGSTFMVTQTQRLIDYLGLAQPRFKIRASVADGSYRLRKVKNDPDYLLQPIREWADEVRQIVEEPDYWAEMKRGGALIADIQGSQGAENTPFTQDEQDQIAAQLNRIRESLADRFELSNEQVERIAERLDEAAEASKRMGRKDWLLLFGGSVLSLILTDIVTPGVAEHIFMVTIHGIAHLFTGGSEPPQIPPRTLA